MGRRPLLERISAGDGLGPLAGLSLAQLQPLVDAGEAAFKARNLPLARRVFTALEALFPAQAVFILRRAAVEAEAGDRIAALASLERFYRREALLDVDASRAALELQAALFDRLDPERAALCRERAAALGASH